MNQIFKTRWLFLCLLSVLLIAGGRVSGQGNFQAIESRFITPPDSIQTSVYWYWINGNISKEAVVKDLNAMKKAGINRAFIGNIGTGYEETPIGPVRLFSDEWWDIMHLAFKTATELDIELGVFNSPGWSQAGGPWVKPEQAMRYLASSEKRVKGPLKFSGKLEQPTEHFQDVKVLAWPVPDDYEKNLMTSARVEITPQQTDADLSGKGPMMKLGLQEETILDITLKEKSMFRSIVLYPSEHPLYAECEILIKEGDQYRSFRRFNINRTNPSLNAGYEPYAPVAISIPATTTENIRIVFRCANQNSGIAKVIVSSTPIVERYSEKTLAKMFETPLPYWHDYLWDEQPPVKDASLLVNPDQVRDISRYLSADGTLTWDVPEGEWIIMRTGMAPTGVQNAASPPEGMGIEVDKMSQEHLLEHFDAFLGEIIRRIPAEDRKTWKVIVQDSYETGGQNITDGFLEEFQRRYSYDPVPFLPVYQGHTIGNPDLSDRFLWDMRRLVADKVAYDYVGGFRKIGNKHGLTTWLENYGHWGFPGEFLQYGGQSDEIGGEFWSEGNLGDIEIRAASSCAHTYGKTKVSCESFTSAHNAYGRHPAGLKRREDWSFTEGVNNVVLHVYIQQPYDSKPPGVNAWFGAEFNRLNTWFPQMDLFVNYIKRSSFMLQQGLDVADAAYFIGEDAPKMTGVRDPALPKGYSFDYINAEVILRDLSVKDGRLVLPHGTSYRLLVLPPLETIRPEVLQKIEQLVADGATILGTPPSRSPSMENYPAADRQVQALAAKMWGNPLVKQRAYGKGTILTGMSMEEAFAFLRVAPDCQIDDKTPVLYTHRRDGDTDIYFVTNQSDQTIRFEPKFRVQGKQPELWDAVTGSMRTLPAFAQNGEITSVPLQLEANESAFIVFRKPGIPSAAGFEGNYPAFETLVSFKEPWKVTFESDEFKRGPSKAVTFPTLSDWTEHNDESIKYYSGTAVYTTSFRINKKPSDKKLYLDLGKVNMLGKVKVNGKYVGGAWTPPYRLDVTDWVKEGKNTVEIEVVNTWVNRLIGDQRLPEDERHTWSHVNPWKADSPLQSSGLLGPVNLLSISFP